MDNYTKRNNCKCAAIIYHIKFIPEMKDVGLILNEDDG